MEYLNNRMRMSAVLRMLFIFTTPVAIVDLTVNLTDLIKCSQNISGANPFDKRNAKDSQLNNTNIVDSEKQYDLEFNINTFILSNWTARKIDWSKILSQQ